MYLIAGLGNPGRKYRVSPHNIGFDVIASLAQRHSIQLRASRKFHALLGEGTIASQPVVVMQPTTFMNQSGEAVVPYLKYHNLPPEQLVVISDDVNLPMGRIRIREQGSHGGHKGLYSIVCMLDSTGFPRVRVGVLPPNDVYDITSFVLTPLWGKEKTLMADMVEIAADAVEMLLSHGITAAMNKYNGLDLLQPDSDPDTKGTEKEP